MKRRDFLQGLLMLPVAGTLAETKPSGPVASARAQVIRAADPAVRTGPEQFDAARLAKMLDGALARLTNTGSPEAAWKALFSSKDVVGIKVNCLAGPPLSTHPALVDQIVRGLRLAGVPDGNIFIWERFSRELARMGFKVQDSAGAVHCVGLDGHYENTLSYSGKVGSCLAPPVASLCTAHINVPILKDHLLAGLGVGMKNFYGAIHNPNKYHDNLCDPYVADVSAFPQIRNRLRLVVCDALNGQYDGGPTVRPQRLWEENALLVSRDPVALDTVAWGMIEQRRAAAGLKSLAQEKREPTWLKTANGYGLGENDPQRIEVIQI